MATVLAIPRTVLEPRRTSQASKRIVPCMGVRLHQHPQPLRRRISPRQPDLHCRSETNNVPSTMGKQDVRNTRPSHSRRASSGTVLLTHARNPHPRCLLPNTCNRNSRVSPSLPTQKRVGSVGFSHQLPRNQTMPSPDQLRISLRPGQRVRVVGIPRVQCEGVVVGLIDRGIESDMISASGYWTIRKDDGHHRDFERRHLVAITANR